MSVFRWRVQGTGRGHGTMHRPVDDEGVLEAEGTGEVLDQLVRHGSFWDSLDQSEPLTITIDPAEASP